MDFIEELKWRGLYYDMIPGTEMLLKEGSQRGYIGFDPTAPSLGIGNLVQIIILKHFQKAGHTPIALLGGATGMIGDPSGKSEERKLQSEDDLRDNAEKVKNQLLKYLDSEGSENKTIFVNNYDWYREINVLSFLRDVGKHLSINYMMAKDSVKSRLETGISFTEFSYQLLQAYDFHVLYKEKNCKIQMGGSDQWGNLTSGVELIRRLSGGEAFAVTTPLVTKADGTKFGKTEKGNIYLSPEMTSPYSFYQFWLNVSDEDARNFIKIFTFLEREEIESLINEHSEVPHQRLLQRTIAREITVWIHGKEEYDKAVEASDILFGKATTEKIKSIDERTLLSAMDGVPTFEVSGNKFDEGLNILELLSAETTIFPSKGEARRMVAGNGISINKEKAGDIEMNLGKDDLINNKYLLIQKGKKNYYLIRVV